MPVEALALERTLTELDHARLSSLLRSDPRRAGALPHRAAIEAVLDGCAIVPSRQVPPDVVTMYSRVELRDPDSGHRQTLTLCYPGDAAPAADLVSALTGLAVAAACTYATAVLLMANHRFGTVSIQPSATPGDAAPAAGLVSVLSPVGASLLGLTPGCVAHWSTPGGAERQAEIVTLQFQPEADGDYLK